MVTDFQFFNLPECSDDFTSINEVRKPNPEQSTYVGYGLKLEHSTSSIDLHNYVFPPSPDFGTLVQSLDDSGEFSDHASHPVFKFLDHMLMEENMDEELSMFHDPLALQVTEKSFYDVIDKEYPASPSINIDNERANNLCERTCEADKNSVQSAFTGSQLLVHSANSSKSTSGGQVDSFTNMHLVPSIFISHSESVFHFQKGMEEATKFLPTINELVFDSTKYTLPLKSEKGISSISRGRKHLHRQDSDSDARSRKQFAVYKDEVEELSQLFEKIVLRDVKGLVISSKGDFQFHNIDKYWRQNRLPIAPRNGKAPCKKQGVEIDAIYLQSLLVSCAKALASNDVQTAEEYLKQIRHYASSTGDACQRTANVFANALEARLAGIGTQMYAELASKRMSAAEKLNGYQVYRSACPFVEISKAYTYRMILQIAAKASTIHIVDFGISHGFQWPLLFQFMSIRQGGPPKLRITGIDFPQPGFRPAILIEETGQRLAKYCERFNVPFEYQAIARERWETIDINDLKLARDESLVVYCQLGFHKLPEEPEVLESPKDSVLKLIRTMKPNLFVHSIVNGSCNSPIFMTRFREAFFYYSSMFDMLENTLPRSDLHRLHFIEEFYGREVVNIIACEGRQRVVRHETYKQWHIRSLQAGFKILPLDKDIPFKRKVETSYHKDFLCVDDCNWMLQGWKGRVLYATSCWVPV